MRYLLFLLRKLIFKRSSKILGLQLCNDTVTLTGDDSITINDRTLADLADGDVCNLDFPNNIAEGKKGKNRNAIIAFNSTGESVTATIRVIIGSPDDKFFNNEMNTYRNNKAGYTLLTGEFIKRVGDGNGNITNVTYTMSAGFVQKIPTVKENSEGDSEQGISIYTLMFMNTDRSIV